MAKKYSDLGCIFVILFITLYIYMILAVLHSYRRPHPAEEEGMVIKSQVLPRVVHNAVRTTLPRIFNSGRTDEFDSSSDPNHCADASTSVIKLTDQKREFQLGETIQVTIQLFDSYKQPKTKGGDFVQVWMKEESKNARAAGVITDHNNGVYTGMLKALWTGSPQIEASVVGPRETMQIFHRIFRDHYTLRNITALFESGGVKEETLCLPIPGILVYPFVCNLTAENYGLPWYCGKPSNRKLLCQDFTGLREPESQPLLFTEHEKKFFASKYLHQNLPKAVQVIVKSDKEFVPLPTTPCKNSPLRKSWEASTPVGFFYKNQWKSLTCDHTIPSDPELLRKCFKDRTIWTHGDSTSRQWFLFLQQRITMDLVTEPWAHSKWHKPAILRNAYWNITATLVPHEYPFYHGYTFNKLAYNRATHVYLDELPNDTRDIFVIHLYLHFNPFPPEVYRTHIRRIVKSVGTLVSRAPRVTIAIRGPHAFKGREKVGFLDDIWMFEYDRILREEFKGYEDKILFLNNVDLTIATENDDQHPNYLALMSLLLGQGLDVRLKLVEGWRKDLDNDEYVAAILMDLSKTLIAEPTTCYWGSCTPTGFQTRQQRYYAATSVTGNNDNTLSYPHKEPEKAISVLQDHCKAISRWLKTTK